jgi:antitoxin ParD1/3/4
MRTTQSLSITLPHEMAQMVKAKVTSGEYATESEVIRDGLRTLAARDAAVEKWLREEVVPTLEANKADPSRLVSAEEAWKQLSAHMAK